MMPKFHLTIRVGDDSQLHRALGMLPARFPEIDVLDRRESADHTQIWTCRAPTRFHIERWCHEASITHSFLETDGATGGESEWIEK